MSIKFTPSSGARSTTWSDAGPPGIASAGPGTITGLQHLHARPARLTLVRLANLLVLKLISLSKLTTLRGFVVEAEHDT
ncbi:hypothetical protein [Deinococcus hopiensis]|uniref:hypothetical protein n=1 Tax=Deinococcus hopiensis TaxID=309885 RepID=UPI001482C563|nr:hypothetical protein [Deinococcus hopiensis]